MAKLTDEMYWLAQDIYCRFVVTQNLQPEGEIQQVAQTCIALSSEFFAAFEATQDASQEAERKALAHELANALMVELRGASNGASTEDPATPTEASKGNMTGKAPGAPAEAIAAPLPASPARKAARRKR
jgi:hypothetical protein